MSAWNRIFWKNVRSLTNARASLSSRLRFWKVLAFGVSDFRFPGIRPCRTTGVELDAYFNKFIRRMVKLVPQPDENADTFCRRRNRTIQSVKLDNNLDVKLRLCLKITTWLEHLLRHPDSIGHKFLLIQDGLWLRTIRYLVSNTSNLAIVDAGRTGTRSGPGPPIRFLDCWFEPLFEQGCFVNPMRCKRTSKEYAQRLYDQVFQI